LNFLCFEEVVEKAFGGGEVGVVDGANAEISSDFYKEFAIFEINDSFRSGLRHIKG
jgi:hypothetical protein